LSAKLGDLNIHFA